MVAESPRRAVLVTRPAGRSAEGLCQRVREAGFEAFSEPLLQITGLPELPPAQRRLLLDLDRCAHIIFISTNAVEYGMGYIADCWPQLPVGLQWYAIGGATAESLAEYGVNAHTPGDNMTSEGLLALSSLQDIAGQRVLIVKGEGGRDALRQALLARGAQVDELQCYRRSPPSLPAGELADRLERWQVGAILVSSGEGLANLQLLLTPEETTKFKRMALVVPSERVAVRAREAGFGQVVVADNASDAAMLDALRQWIPGTGE